MHSSLLGQINLIVTSNFQIKVLIIALALYKSGARLDIIARKFTSHLMGHNGPFNRRTWMKIS